MKRFQDLSFEPITEAHIDILSPIMKAAFDEDARIHLNEPTGGPPGYDNGDFLRRYALDSKTDAYFISYKGNPLGAVILWISPEHVNFLGNIFIDPAYQNMGLGLKIWNIIENEYPDTILWQTETPGFSKRNHHFYVNKCGFRIIKIANPMSQHEESYVMEKPMRAAMA